MEPRSRSRRRRRRRRQGYALYDMVVMRVHGGEPFSMWAHHAAEALGCFFMTCFRQAAFFPMMFAITEVTVLPGNAMWLAQKFSRSDTSRAVPALLLARFVAFLVFRTFILPYTLWYAVRRDQFLENVKATHPFVTVLSAINMVRFCPMLRRGKATRLTPRRRLPQWRAASRRRACSGRSTCTGPSS